MFFRKFFQSFYEPDKTSKYSTTNTTLPDVVGDSDYVVSAHAQDYLDNILFELKFSVLDRASKITTQYSERFDKPKVDKEAIQHILHEHNLDRE